MKLRFGTNDVYSHNLGKHNIEAKEIIFNSIDLQASWLKDHTGGRINPFISEKYRHLHKLNSILRGLEDIANPLVKIFQKQINYYDPKIIYFQDLNVLSPRSLYNLKKSGRILIGQIASPLPSKSILKCYDLILSSLPNIVTYLRSLGINSSFLPIGFDTRILDEINDYDKSIPVSFVGGISNEHSSTIPMLNAALQSTAGVDIYGYGKNYLTQFPQLAKVHKGEKWGLEMYQVLASSKITLNRHIDIAGNYANNMRMFEATGMGALLITDHKVNLHEYFTPNEEILSYKSVGELTSLINWALGNSPEILKMSKKAQLKTISQFSYENVIGKLVNEISKYL